MTQGYSGRKSFGRTLVGCVLALFLGLLSPFLLMVETMSLMPVVLIPVLLSAAMAVWFGNAAVFALNGAFLGTMYLGFGFPGFLMGMVGVLPPIVSILLGMRRREPFFDQMERSVMLAILAMAGAVTVAFVFWGSNLIGQVIRTLEEQIASIPEEFFRTVLAYSGLDASGYSMTELRSLYTGILGQMEKYYVYFLPGRLLSGAALTSVLGVLWGNWLMARRGDATAQSYISLENWRLPAKVSIGALALLLVSFLMAGSGFSMGGTAFYTVYDLATLAFAIQTAASLCRRMKQGGFRPGARITLTCLIVLLPLALNAGFLLCIYGVASALFGSEGLIRKAIERQKNGPKDN